MAHNERENNYFVHYCRTKRSECKRKNIPYDLDASYLEEIWTGECPIFHIALSRNHKGRGSPPINSRTTPEHVSELK